MSSTIWTPSAVASEAGRFAANVWRVVEAQHVAATMALLDDPAEQAILEQLLDDAKPSRRADTERLHYLLATPFRYPTTRGGSRFRATTDPGVFYAALEVKTACFEIAYWRWRFLADAVELDGLPAVAHTAFRTSIETAAVDLRGKPFTRDAQRWSAPDDYSATQAFARVARQAAVGAVLYASVRDPQHRACVALLDPAAFARRAPASAMHTWWLRVTRNSAVFRRDSTTLAASFA